MDVMPLEATLYSHFQLATIDNTNMADERTLEVRECLAPLVIGFCNVAW